jgi:PIN domain nuclease of toxin-antitoxin system
VNLLLDTQVFLWWDQRSSALNASARAAIEDARNNIFVSAASVWEIAIKHRRGKLEFSGSVSAAIASNGFHDLPILPLEAEEASDLAWRHSDPFDRVLVAQAKHQGLIFVTGDETIRDLDIVPRLWAR